MIQRNKILIILIILVFPLISFSQKIENAAIFTSSGKIGNSLTLDYVFGQYANFNFSSNGYSFVSPFSAFFSEEKQEPKEKDNYIVSTKVFPNPVNDQLNISITSIEKINTLEVKIYSTDGHLIKTNSEISNYDNFSKITLSTAYLSTGIYWAKITINKTYVRNVNFTKQ